jgi:hypothetical protein
MLIYIAGIWACFPLAGLMTHRLPAAYQIIGWVTAFIVSLLIMLWLQFVIVDRLLFMLERIPVFKKFFEWSFTRNYNRYIAPGFKPNSDNR